MGVFMSFWKKSFASFGVVKKYPKFRDIFYIIMLKKVFQIFWEDFNFQYEYARNHLYVTANRDSLCIV